MPTDILVISANPSFNWSFGSSGDKAYGYAESGGKAYVYAIWERNLEITPPSHMYRLGKPGPMERNAHNKKIN